MQRIYFLLFFFIIIPFVVSSQTPTDQDCAGAIPICQNVYSETNSYSGTGGFANEVNTATSCTDGEINDVWYTFTAQTTGNFSFVLTPNNTSGSGDDYDWTVFNLTNATCADIYSNAALEISCNSWGSTTAFNGATGASTAHGGSGNHNGPGDTNGPEFNQDIPVVAGNIYVMMVSNWSGSTYGYTIDFSSSTAQIFDNVPPHIESILSNIGCGATSITFEFSENILCSTIAACDLTLTGPGGPYTITSITGASCASGGTQERVFTISVTPAISASGSYSLNLDANACNSVTDLCGNVAPSGSLPFSVTAITSSVTTQTTTCGQTNGSASVTASGGSGNFTYTWSTTPVQTGTTATNLGAGTYTVTVNDGSCSSTASAIVATSGGFSLLMSTIDENCSQSNGSASVSASGGSGSYTYLWSTTPAQTTPTASNLSAGTYTVTVDDGSCTVTDNAVITNIANLSASIGNVQNASCGMSDGTASVIVTGGTQPIQYSWNTNPVQTSATASNIPAGNYSVTVTDADNCSTVLTTVINVASYPVASITHTNAHCGQADGSATATVSGGGAGPFTYLWNTGDSTQTINNLMPGIYTVSVSNGHCDTTALVSIMNVPGPTASFWYHPNPITIDHPEVVFTSGTENAVSWQWDFGDSTGTACGQSVIHPFYSVNNYTVTLIVTDSYGCSDTTSQLVIVHDIFTIYIPNSFTPDGDGKNDVFQAYGISWEPGDYDMIIYDRWGNIMYKTDDPSQPWNGGYHNNPSRADKIPGVYVYRITVKGINCPEKIYMGSVTLLR